MSSERLLLIADRLSLIAYRLSRIAYRGSRMADRASRIAHRGWRMADRVGPLVIAHLPGLTLVMLALMAALPLWGPGLVNTRGGGDSPFLLWRVHQLVANLRDGVLPARWMPDAAYGLGYPFFSYYAALPYYLASLFHLVGLDMLTAIKLTQTLGFVLAALAGYGWFRRALDSQAAAWLGAVAYTFAPFHLVNVYVRGDSLSEFYAFIFYPLILWAIDNTTKQPTIKNAIALGLAYGGLVTIHTLSAAIFSPFVVLYALFRVLNVGGRKSEVGSRWSVVGGQRSVVRDRWSKSLPGIITITLGLALGLALAAWYWLPASLELDYVQTGTLQQGYFHYSGHFRRLALSGEGPSLVQSSPGFVYDTASGSTGPFAMGLMQAVMAGAGLGLYLVVHLPYFRHARRNTPHATRHTSYLIPSLLLATFMITPLSRPLWDHLPLLPMVQFPWRFLSVQALFAAMTTAFIVENIGRSDLVPGRPQAASAPPDGGTNLLHSRRRIGAAILIAALLSLAVMLPLHPDRLMIDAGDVTTERLQLYELFTANIGTTITYEWLPRAVNPRPYTSEIVSDPTAPPRLVAIEGELVSARETLHRSTSRTWQVDVSTEATLVFPLLYWPGWNATIDGAPVTVHPAHSSGRIALDVPRGQHTIVLQLGRTPLRLAAELVSLLAWAGIGLCVARYTWRVARCTSHVARGTLRVALCIALSVVGGLLLIMAANRSPLPDRSTETMDLIQMPYLQRGAVHFDHATLTGYHIEPEQTVAGQTICVTLHWDIRATPLTVTVSLVGLSEHLPDLRAPIVLSQSVAQWTATPSSHLLTIPPDLPAGVYLIQVRVLGMDGEQAAWTANGSQRGWIYLRPVYVHNDRPIGDEPALATFGDRIRLHAVHAEQHTPTQLLVKLDWSASRPVSANYNLALRLYNAHDDRLASVDTQPGHGFLPVTTWRAGVKITDRLMLPLPEGLPPREDYQLEIILYDLANNLAGVGQYIQSNVTLTHYTHRAADSTALAYLTPQLALVTLDLPATHPQGAPVLTFRAGWLATAAPAAHTLAQWSLADETGDTVATHTVALNTGDWPAGAYVLDVVHIPVPMGLAAGRYHLTLALMEASTGVMLGQTRLASTLQVTGRARTFTLPPLDHRLEIQLGNQVRLEGYNLSQDKENLRLTLAWRAQKSMTTDYTVFVHLLTPQETIATQHDAMPLENTYPTSWWVPGEVVTETITLSLRGLPSGAFRLAVGMYEVRTQTRLEAYTSDGQRLPADRILLTEDILIP